MDAAALGARVLAKIRAKIEADIAVHIAEVEGLEARLRNWHAAQLRLNPSLTRIELPTGTLTSTKARRSTEVPSGEDLALLIKWAAEHGFPDWVHQPPVPAETVAKDAVKQAVKARKLRVRDDGTLIDGLTGEIVPGIRLTLPDNAVDGRTFTINAGDL
jgi:hypothetical protein